MIASLDRDLYFDNSRNIKTRDIDIGAGVLDQVEAAQGFAALGSEQRLSVLLTLVSAGPAGLSAGALADRVGLGASTLTHHLRFLTQAGLVTQRRVGRSVLSFADFDRVRALSEYLILNCCADAPEGAAQTNLGPNT